jgi:hypothetical protein
MSPCRTSKGTFDDKAFAKCHTSARKYFLLSLFQIPTEDEDADAGPRKTRTETPVPGPSGYVPPHRIDPLRAEKFPEWVPRYEKSIAHSKTAAELVQWDELNDDLLSQLNSGNPDLYARVMQTVAKLQAELAESKIEAWGEKRGEGLIRAATTATKADDPITSGPQTKAARPEGCPDCAREPDAFLKWADDRMARINDADELALIFREEIDPATDGIMRPDYTELQAILARHEKRLGAD